jgi:hypothetical protein
VKFTWTPFGAIDSHLLGVREGDLIALAPQEGDRTVTSSVFALALVFATITASAVMVGAVDTKYDLTAESATLRYFPGYEKPVHGIKGDRLDIENFGGVAALDRG